MRLLGLVVFLFTIGSPAFADQANVFVYHRFNDLRYPSTNIATPDFRAQLDLLHQQEFTVLKLGQIVDRLQRGESLPQRCAAITVDDAYTSFLTDGWPLLKQYGFPVTLFVSTDTVGGKDYLDWQELRVLEGEGVEIGNHSAAHAYLLDRLPAENSADWKARVIADLQRSQQAFEHHLDRVPQLFAYPYGEFSPELAKVIKTAGFIAAFGQQSGVLAVGQDFFSLPRFPVGGNYASFEEFRRKLFMKNLALRVVSPDSPVMNAVNPPEMRFYIETEGVDLSSLRCFVSGQPECQVRAVTGEGGLYEVVASQPLVGRRSKYTVTASDKRRSTWYWYSQLWIQPLGGDAAD